jgi:23S rRNA pseudouridine955/2504/2580 synthase
MKEFIISHQEEGQRFDKYLVKCLPKAQKSFLYKMLRKKNIVLNGKKADGNEKIKAGDSVKIFFSDETFEKFSDEKTSVKIAAVPDKVKLDVLYEDDKFLIVNKPSGMLSQKAEKMIFRLSNMSMITLLRKKNIKRIHLRPVYATDLTEIQAE